MTEVEMDEFLTKLPDLLMGGLCLLGWLLPGLWMMIMGRLQNWPGHGERHVERVWLGSLPTLLPGDSTAPIQHTTDEYGQDVYTQEVE